MYLPLHMYLPLLIKLELHPFCRILAKLLEDIPFAQQIEGPTTQTKDQATLLDLTTDMPQSTQETTLIERTDQGDQSSISCALQKKKRKRSDYELSPQEHLDTPTKELEGCRSRLRAKAATPLGEPQNGIRTEADTIARNNEEKYIPQCEQSSTEDESDSILGDIPSDQHHFPHKEPIDDGANPYWSRAMRTVQICMRNAGNLPGRPIKCTFPEHQIHRYGSFKWGHEIYGSFDNHDLHVHYIRNCQEQGFPYLARNEHRDAVKYFWPNETQTQENVLPPLNASGQQQVAATGASAASVRGNELERSRTSRGESSSDLARVIFSAVIPFLGAHNLDEEVWPCPQCTPTWHNWFCQHCEMRVLPAWTRKAHFGQCGQSCPCCRHKAGECFGACTECEQLWVFKCVAPAMRHLLKSYNGR